MAGAEEKVGSRAAGLRFLGIVAALLPAPAAAGAWVAPQRQTIVTATVGAHEDGGEYYESALYFEEPLGRRTSVVVTPWSEWDDETEDGWRGEAFAGVKRVIREREGRVTALQVGAVWVSQPDWEVCSEGGVEGRVLDGYSFAEGRAFLNVETSSRALVGGCFGGRLDVTAGYRPSERWLATGQVFYDAPVAREETVKAQVSLVRFDAHGRGWQIGLRATLNGDDAAPALVVGLWQSSRD
ncbi:MAG: hypothetical protein KF779_04390 [Hyphomonadaceae bacterium]|nr:hypothetical protein [Hyphomonadaceae bacterium]MCA8886063.1 hypothetical protein [Hyphomonadaceae bacterium]